MDKINWLSIYNEIDIDVEIVKQSHLTNNTTEKSNYYNKGTLSLTLTLLQNLKRETYFFDRITKIRYLESLKGKIPQTGNSESPLLNQVSFKAESNYCDFITIYINELKKLDSKEINGKQKLKHKQIALIHAYNDNPINSSNEDEIALEYGYDSKTSGHKLKQLYNDCRRSIDRKGDTGSLKKNQNKIDDIKSIYGYLSSQGIEVAKKEVLILESIQKEHIQ